MLIQVRCDCSFILPWGVIQIIAKTKFAGDDQEPSLTKSERLREIARYKEKRLTEQRKLGTVISFKEIKWAESQSPGNPQKRPTQ